MLAQRLLRLAMGVVVALGCASAMAKNVPPTVALTAPSNGASFTAPVNVTISAAASDSDGTVSKVDFYSGTTLLSTVTAAPYAYTWANVPAGTYSLTAKATDNLGAATTSSAVSITVAAASTATTITSPTAGSDVGASVNVSGTFTGTADTAVLVSNGTNSTVVATINGTNNTYVAEGVPMQPGANNLTATAVRRDGTSSAASVSVTYPRGYVVMTSPTKGTPFDTPASLTLQASAMTATGGVQRIDYYKQTSGGLVTQLGSATTAPYTYIWANPPTGSYSVYAVMTDDRSRTWGSSFLGVSVLGPNQLPTVSLTSPVNGANLSAPATITFQAMAADSDGTISLVEFLQNGQVVATSNVAPYTAVLPNVAPGTYVFAARATDDRGGVTTSAPASVVVTSPNAPPTVGLTSPQANASFAVLASISLAATAADSDGTIAKVEFLVNNVLVGTATSAPYAVTWAVTTAGTYTVTATAYDNLGAATLSAPVTVTVTDGITYLHTDVVGNPVAATDSSGAIIWKESYRPYGDRLNNQASASKNRQWFHGKEVDADTGLSYFGARYYDPTLGRFMGVDPVGFKETNLHSFNRYAYGNNNPYRFIDPDGREPLRQRPGTPPEIRKMLEQERRVFGQTGSVPNAGGSTGSDAPATSMVAPSPLALGGYNSNSSTPPPIKAGAAGGELAGKPFAQAIREAAFQENPLRICVFCRREGVATQVDHAIPKVRGGDATLENAQLACPHCNASKGARDYPVNPPPNYTGKWPPTHWGSE